jgi:DNA-binding MarR family transcriptional regulator
LISLRKLVSIANYNYILMSTKKHKAERPPAKSRPRTPVGMTKPEEAEAESREAEAGGRKAEALTVADSLHSAAIHILRRVRKQDVATGEGPARLSALSALVFGGPKTLGELATAEQVKPPTMSRIVAGLARNGLIHIEHDPKDARRMIIHATAQGVELLQKGRELRIAYLADHLDRLTRDELLKLGEAVEILQSLLKNWEMRPD